MSRLSKKIPPRVIRQIPAPPPLKDPAQTLRAAVEGPPRCVICGGDVAPWPGGGGYGNSAQPVADGRCCDACNWARVIPERIQRMRREEIR